ncbi:hypothetical protein RF11_03655 [Thelohanellus kitauei]|uniref:Uncharacterized protein n=1 Tax=Thelohanellus kitauei TaxID=669202 RepID=A0A0C2J3I0_THEKT|nr:hypothetical protein RF11_03655 [Thelohanellus kitauei]
MVLARELSIELHGDCYFFEFSFCYLNAASHSSNNSNQQFSCTTSDSKITHAIDMYETSVQASIPCEIPVCISKLGHVEVQSRTSGRSKYDIHRGCANSGHFCIIIINFL